MEKQTEKNQNENREEAGTTMNNLERANEILNTLENGDKITICSTSTTGLPIVMQAKFDSSTIDSNGRYGTTVKLVFLPKGCRRLRGKDIDINTNLTVYKGWLDINDNLNNDSEDTDNYMFEKTIYYCTDMKCNIDLSNQKNLQLLLSIDKDMDRFVVGESRDIKQNFHDFLEREYESVTTFNSWAAILKEKYIKRFGNCMEYSLAHELLTLLVFSSSAYDYLKDILNYQDIEIETSVARKIYDSAMLNVVSNVKNPHKYIKKALNYELGNKDDTDQFITKMENKEEAQKLAYLSDVYRFCIEVVILRHKEYKQKENILKALKETAHNKEEASKLLDILDHERF